jgi:hypothetical protein
MGELQNCREERNLLTPQGIEPQWTENSVKNRSVFLVLMLDDNERKVICNVNIHNPEI